MSTISDSTIESAMKRWDDARNLLVGVLSSYLDSCTSLKNIVYSGYDHTSVKDIESRIDTILDSFQRDMIQKLAQSTSTVAQTRNKLSFIGRFPEDILSEIFLHVVYDSDNKGISMSKYIKAMYSNLRILMGVCSVWRNLALTQGVLWETIPPCDHPFKYEAIDLSIRRSGDCGLRFTIMLPQEGAEARLVELLRNNISRLHTLHLESRRSDLEPISKLIAELLWNGVPGRLSELSICYPPTSPLLLRKTPCVMHKRPSDEGLFTRLVESISILRLSWVQIQWKNTTFSDRLVELLISNVKLGHFSLEMSTFLSAISSAVGLRDLKIVGVRVDVNPTETTSMARHPKVVFPKLRSLLLYDLQFNVLESLLSTIAPGSYKFTLGLTHLALTAQTSNGIENKIYGLAALLETAEIDTISVITDPIPRFYSGGWLNGFELRQLLASLPRLKQLGLDGWSFNEDFCNTLFPPSNTEMECKEPQFPRLESLIITGARIMDREILRTTLTKISAQTTFLGGLIEEEGYWSPLTGSEEIVGWLKCRIPGFHFVSSSYSLPGKDHIGWRF